MQSVTQEIEKLRVMPVSQLVERYEAEFGKPPRVKNKTWLWRRIAWKVQENRFGGLSETAKRTLEELISEIDLPQSERERNVTGKLTKPRRPNDPLIGTTLTREWHGKEISVKVVDGGYEYEGVIYNTLTEAVRGITGSHWNPKIFFNLIPRKRK